MSTRNTDVEEKQGASQGVAGAILNEETVPLGSPSPPNASSPSEHPDHNRRNVWLVIVAVVIVLALIFSTIAVFLAQPGRQTGSQAATPGTKVPTPVIDTDTTPVPSPGVAQGPQNGPSNVNTMAYWDTILGTKGTDGKVESVSFANMMGNPSLQALVTVRHNDANKTLDVYVFNNITNKNPTQIFKLTGLIKGEAKISYYNSIMTAQVDQNSSINVGHPVKQWTADLFREFEWSASKGTMVQVAFPGIFPDLTRYEAEADQVLVNKGQDTWKNDPAQVAKALASKFFKWTRALTAKVLEGGGARDVSATVQVQELPLPGGPKQGPTAIVTLSRLEGNTRNLWVVTAVRDDTGTLTNIPARSLITSPVRLEGKGSAFDGTIGLAVIFDHTKSLVGQAIVTGTPGMGDNASYSIAVSYNTSFKAGPQEGIVGIEFTGAVEADPYTHVMVKVLINPNPTTSIQDPAYWTQFVSIPPETRVADSVSFGHLLGNTSLQALVVARDILGGGPLYRDVFVFDKINDPHPKLLWHESRLLHGDAKISPYNTVMTAQVDVGSSLNKGKLEAALTTDLFREFKWSNGPGTFAQTVFPGFFPDLTRWQAEAAQAQVNAGQNTWRNDLSQVVKLLATQLMKWQGKLTVNVLSGGGSNDVSASVQVQGTPIQNAQPMIVVTLSRLEGNIHNIWEVIGVKSGSTLTLTNIPAASLISSPVTLAGTGSAYEAVIGQGVVYDHLYTAIGHEQLTGRPGMGIATYSIKVPYVSSFKGMQEGIVVAYQDMGGLSSGYYSAVMVKVLISG